MSKKKKQPVLIDANYALTEVANLLTHASDIAIQKKSIKSMIDLSTVWAEFGKLLYDLSGGASDPKSEEVSEEVKEALFGFGSFELAENNLESEYEFEEEDE